MRLKILGFVLLSACGLFAAGAEGDAAPPLPKRTPRETLAESDAGPPLPERNPMRPATPAPAKPEEAKPVAPGDQPTVAWTEEEIEAAKAKCKELLTGDPLDYDMLQPIKEGICGTPAPVLLRSVGTDPKVIISPPATLNCPMADVLGEWMRDTVQPEAKKLFNSVVVKIVNASAYVCRNRYGAANTPLSEHALANALDVSELVLANGEHITILNDWPKTVEASSAPPDSSSSGTVAGTATSKPADKSTNVGAITAAKAQPAVPPSLPRKEPEQHLKSQFVVYLHDEACHLFGTVLGPEANAAHKGHFHLDMKVRKKSFCE